MLVRQYVMRVRRSLNRNTIHFKNLKIKSQSIIVKNLKNLNLNNFLTEKNRTSMLEAHCDCI